MIRRFGCRSLIAVLTLSLAGPAAAQSTRIYNTVIEKLAAGQRVVGGTVTSADPNIYCAMANSGFDFLWIEMQHSPLTYSEVAQMIYACRDAPAIPFIRVPDATAGDIQKATDIGALGIIVPLVDSVAKIEAAIQFAKYPPEGIRSQGGGQYRALWGNDYRQTSNDNIMIVAMIESPAGVELADEIAAVPGVDIVMAAATDLGSFSGSRQGEAEFEGLVSEIVRATNARGLYLAGPQAWMNREGFDFFQAGDDTGFIRAGVRELLRNAPQGTAQTEGAEN